MILNICIGLFICGYLYLLWQHCSHLIEKEEDREYMQIAAAALELSSLRQKQLSEMNKELSLSSMWVQKEQDAY